MSSNDKKQRVTFTATKVVSKPAVINFQTKDGRQVTFKGHKDVPESVRVTFFKGKK